MLDINLCKQSRMEIYFNISKELIYKTNVNTIIFLNHRTEKYQVLEGKKINEIPVNKILVKYQMKKSEKLKYF